MNSFHSLIAVVAVFCLFSLAAAADRTADWQAVQKAMNEGLPQTAIDKLNPIIAGALKDGRLGEAAKALTRKIVLEANIQGNKPEEKIYRLEKELDQADPALQPILKVVLARWYWHFYQQNNWRFLNRSATVGLDEKDFLTWDLPKLFGRIASHFDGVLQEEKALLAVPLSSFDDLLDQGNQPPSYRPTLFDFVAYQALDFYTSGEQAAAQPQDAFEIEAGSPALDSPKAFMAWEPTTTDLDSSKYKALRLYQRLMKINMERGNRPGFLDADLARLRWAMNVAVGEEKQERYQTRLREFAEANKDHDLSSLALSWLALELVGQGKKVEAHALATEGKARFPNSIGASDCQAVLIQIEAKTLELMTERVVGQPLPDIRVTYTNIDQVHFRLVPRDWKTLLDAANYSPESLDWQEREKLLQYKPAHTWSETLEPTPDYLSKTRKVPFPKAEPGFYFLISSWKKDFSNEGNAVRFAPVWVSSLGLVTWSNEGRIEGLVVDNETGEPIPGATVKAFQYVYKGWLKKRNYWEEQRSVKTDEKGTFRFSGFNEAVLPVVQARGEVLFGPDSLYCGYSNRHPAQERAFFFTDRAIYRPGQTIQFKALLVKVDTESDVYEVLPNRSVTVVLRDVNNQEVTKQEFRSNGYGSLSGSFVAPVGRLTGAMTLWAYGPSGNASFRVEEYKRPKFKVSIDQPTEGGKLGGEIVMKGEAVSYAGAPIDGATVKFRVSRAVRMPWWWCWWGNPPNLTAREITHGTCRTDSQGKFEIRFVAHPDRSVPEKDLPTFEFSASADVTDGAGETRSAAQSVRLGFVAMEIKLTAQSWLEAGKPIPVRIQTTTLDGKGIPAKGVLEVFALKGPEKPKRPALEPEAEPDLANLAAWESGKKISEEAFATSPEGGLEKVLNLPAGAFRLVARGNDKFGKEVQARLDLTVVDLAAHAFPVAVPNAFKIKQPTVEVGDTFVALWGTGYDKGTALVEIEHRNRLLQQYWTKPGTTQHVIEIPVKEGMRGGFTVRVTFVRENRFYQETTNVVVPWSNKQLELKFEHFTSKLLPGAQDSWSIRIKGPGAEMKAVEMAATLYDASLDAFMMHSWPGGLGIFRQNYSSVNGQFGNRSRGLEHLVDSWQPGWGFMTRSYQQFPYEIIMNFHGYGAVRRRGAGGPEGMMLDEISAPSESRSEMSLNAAAPAAQVISSEKEFDGESKKKDLGLGGDKAGAGGGGAAPGGAAPDVDLSKVAARTNLNETAFFFPHLAVEGDGTVKLTFTMPEALTTWKFFGFAHGMKGEGGLLTGETITQKDLMVQPNPPRFLREGDRITFTAKVTNMTDSPLKGKVRLSLSDPATEKVRDADFGLTQPDQVFEIPARESRSFGWPLQVPDGAGVLTYKVVAATEKQSDGEEALLPILSKRILVHEALPLPIRGPATKKFTMKKLVDSAGSDTLVSQGLTIQVTSNPAWYAVQALPYLMEFPHECCEQVFSRIYANSLARHIALSDPRIKKIFEAWKADEAFGGKALVSNLEKNEDLKNVLLIETPWVCQAKSETQAKHQIGVLFDENRIRSELERAMRTLEVNQFGDGSWPWFPGGRPDPFITLHITTGFGRLRHLGVTLDQTMSLKAVNHLDEWLDETYREILRHGNPELNHLTSTIALYFYGRSFFLKDKPVPGSAKEAVDYFLGQAKKYWLELGSRLSQGHLALGLHRFGDKTTADKIAASLKERSVNEEEMGRYWRDTELSWWWYRAPIETQSIMIEVFSEIVQDEVAVEDCKVWLLKQKQTQDWKTTKATADAIYALLLKGANLLASDKLVKVSLGGEEVKPEKVEAGTGFYEKRWAGPEVKPSMGEISMVKEDKGVAWGGIHWQYLEDMSKVTPAETNLKLVKTLFVKTDSDKGPVISPVSGKLGVGDLLVVRIELRVDRDMEYVHLKDGRGSGLEPVDVLSGYRYQDGLAYYQSTKDTASHFFIDYLPKGTYVFEYNLRVQHKGRYQTGMAEIQCMYAPEFSSHSQSFFLEVE